MRELGLLLGPRRKLRTAIAALKRCPGSNDINPMPDPEMKMTARPPPGLQAERRQLTVMFVDLVGSTA
jgi:class 3 adenylate cyclase